MTEENINRYLDGDIKYVAMQRFIKNKSQYQVANELNTITTRISRLERLAYKQINTMK